MQLHRSGILNYIKDKSKSKDFVTAGDMIVCNKRHVKSTPTCGTDVWQPRLYVCMSACLHVYKYVYLVMRGWQYSSQTIVVRNITDNCLKSFEFGRKHTNATRHIHMHTPTTYTPTHLHPLLYVCVCVRILELLNNLLCVRLRR